MQLIHGDCLEVMTQIPDKAVHMVLCDLPYGTTYCAWDAILPFDRLWAHYKRVTTDNAAIILTASQPFTSALVMSNPGWFRYEWIWDKHNPTNFANANRQPLKQHENILVFYQQQCRYQPIKQAGAVNHRQGKSTSNKSATRLISGRVEDDLSGLKFPKSILPFPKHSSQCGLHPTQKPVALFEYLIKTYTQEGDTVLDNCMGSGTTGMACLNLNRQFIGIELDQNYFDVASQRLIAHQSQCELFHFAS